MPSQRAPGGSGTYARLSKISDFLSPSLWGLGAYIYTRARAKACSWLVPRPTMISPSETGPRRPHGWFSALKHHILGVSGPQNHS